MRRVAPFLPLALLVACAPAASPTPQPTLRWLGSLEARPAFPEVRASVTAVRAAGTTTVQIDLTGAAPGSTYPWHLHQGTCETGGGIVGDPAAYPPLRVNPAGRALETAVLEVEIAPGQAYHVNVHRSTDDLRTIVACGNLQETGPR
jgi:hypothetical protein